ncbi:MAG: phosphatidylglycerophosphatase A family protein [Candidatus Acidiferrales bacterium]
MSPDARSSSHTPSASEASAATSRSAASRKPLCSIFFATACGLGYIPAAPGTFGSLAGVVIALLPCQLLNVLAKTNVQNFVFNGVSIDPLLVAQVIGAVLIALVGVLVSARTAQHWQQKDPQRVVIDEVSGQHLALLIGSAFPFWWRPESLSWAPHGLGFITYESPLSWQYLLVGFILFRVFDIWKPFPARQAESLRGGWGIMADDWIAGIYAGLCLWAVRGFLL